MTSTRWMYALLAAAMLALAGCAADGNRGVGQTAGEVVDDSVITAKVKSAFVADKEVSALNIGVETNKGVVQLTGNAKNATESRKAAELARNVTGVKAVKNDILVK
jgi:hyperosmotically inducible protein